MKGKKNMIDTQTKGRGISCDIYRSDYDATCNKMYGVKRVILTGDGVTGPWDEDFIRRSSDPVLVLKKYNDYLYAVPIEPVPAGHVGYMFGGTFIYTSDSRFPSNYPIPVHDRTETAEINELLSN